MTPFQALSGFPPSNMELSPQEASLVVVVGKAPERLIWICSYKDR
jgi:hypothetical protein